MSFLDKFHYQVVGQEGQPRVVFLHGLMGSAANWRKVTYLLQDAYHILVMDQRGHGRSFHPPSGFQPEDYASDLKNLLDELHWEEIHLVGHSMGGRNALSFADQWPHRVKSLVLEDIGPDINSESMKRTKELLDLVPTPFINRQEAKRFLLEEFPLKIAANPMAMTLAQYFYSNIEELTNGQADWRFSKMGVLESLEAGRTRERWDQFRKVRCPMLVIRGERSQDLSRAVFQRMLDENAMAEGVEIADSGHWVHFDQPAMFVQCLKTFIDRHSQM
jgi:esterase